MNGQLRDPAISVIVAAYNAENTIEQCVESIVSQTYTDWELIIVNDGSSDDTEAIVSRYMMNDERIHIISTFNQGPSIARNRGLCNAKGEYVCFIDADDWVEPSFLDMLKNSINEYYSDIVVSGYGKFWGDNDYDSSTHRISKYSTVILNSRMEWSSLMLKSETNLFAISVWGKLYKNSIISKYSIRFPEGIDYEEDCCFNLQYYKHVNRGVAIRDILYHYRQNAQSLSKGYRANTIEYLINGYKSRQSFLYEIGMGDCVKSLDIILLMAIKMFCEKIAYGNITRTEKIREYSRLCEINEVYQVANNCSLSNNKLTRYITIFLRKKSPYSLYVLMSLWREKRLCASLIKRMRWKILCRIKGIT